MSLPMSTAPNLIELCSHLYVDPTPATVLLQLPRLTWYASKFRSKPMAAPRVIAWETKLQAEKDPTSFILARKSGSADLEFLAVVTCLRFLSVSCLIAKYHLLL